MSKVRVMHYINQFFAGIGGEQKAEVAVGSQEGPMGPGKRLQSLCGDEVEIVVTVFCGDDYFTAHQDKALESILQIARDTNVQMVVAGPAFAAGRYGFACAQVCHAVSSSLGLDCVTGMHPENAGVATYRQHKDRRVFNFPTADTVAGMEDGLSRMASFITRLAAGSAIGSAHEEGYLSHGLRQVEEVAKSSAQRTIDMLLDKMAGRPFITEIPVESLGAVSPAPPITDLKNACLALVTTAGVVAGENPDGFKVHRNTQWKKYSMDNLNSMTDTDWDVRHGGYNNVYMLANPNYGVPLDVCRELEREGVFARLYPSFYTTPGINGLISVMQSLGSDMASDMKAEGVDAALLVSTWGSCTRSGAVIAKEIERAGIPVVLITAMTMLGKQIGANRIVAGTKIPHPCGDPTLPEEADRALRREIVKTALNVLQQEVSQPTIFTPDIMYALG